jgi:osmotically inducible protein OsmC
LDLRLALPQTMGGSGDATNPEQLFAIGNAACFGNAVIHVIRNKETKIKDDDVEGAATVSMSPNGAGGFRLSVALDVTIAGVDPATADEAVKAAHEACTNSNAVHGNIDVALSVTIR